MANASVVALHEDCVVCLAREGKFDGQGAVKILLMMLGRGVDGEQIVRDLCFAHRREIDELVKQWVKEEPGT